MSREIAGAAAAAPAGAADPLKIGFSMSLTGSLANTGRVAFAAMKLFFGMTEPKPYCSAAGTSDFAGITMWKTHWLRRRSRNWRESTAI